MTAEVLVADTARFADEASGDETVLIDTENGVLYLLTGVGGWLWARAKEPVHAAALTGEIDTRFGNDAAAESIAFLKQLATEGLLVAAPTSTTQNGAAFPLPQTYAPPMLEKFEDIADILTMDPIHDVAPDAGWPFRDR